MKRRPTIQGPGKSRRRHPAPESHTTRNHKSKSWISQIKPKFEPIITKGNQIGVIVLGGCISKDVAMAYYPEGDFDFKDNGDCIEIWTKSDKK